MAKAANVSAKQLQIDRDNAAMLIAVGVAAFLVVFSLFASKALLTQRSYQARVISKKKIALKQLKTDIDQVDKLRVSYQEFADQQQNILGGNAKGSGDHDGENPRVILDALPSKYDFPALTTSINKILTLNSFTPKTISGNDDEVAQASSQPAETPVPVEIPFSVSVDAPANDTKKLLQVFEHSVRPMQLQNLTIKGGGTSVSVDLVYKTYYQPSKKFDIKTEKVK